MKSRVRTLNFGLIVVLLIIKILFIKGICQGIPKVDPNQLPKYYIVGDRVNVRQEPNLQSKVAYQSNWGETYKGIKENKEWIKVISMDESRLYFVHSNFIMQENKFLELAQSQREKTGNTYFEMINILL